MRMWNSVGAQNEVTENRFARIRMVWIASRWWHGIQVQCTVCMFGCEVILIMMFNLCLPVVSGTECVCTLFVYHRSLTFTTVDYYICECCQLWAIPSTILHNTRRKWIWLRVAWGMAMMNEWTFIRKFIVDQTNIGLCGRLHSHRYRYRYYHHNTVALWFIWLLSVLIGRISWYNSWLSRTTLTCNA